MHHSNRDIDRAGVDESGEFSQQYQTVSHAATEVVKSKKGGRSNVSEQIDNDGQSLVDKSEKVLNKINETDENEKSDDVIEISYFDLGHGRASALKLMCAQSGRNWVFKGIKQADWPGIKGSDEVGEFKGLPIVKTKNKTFDLSIPAMRALATDLGYYPINEWQKAATSDMISETWADVFNLWGAALINPDLDDAAKAKVLTDSLNEGAVCYKLFKVIEDLLETNGSKFLCGDTLSMGDFCMASLLFDYFRNESSPFRPALSPLLAGFSGMSTYAENLGEELESVLGEREAKPF